jgi:adenosylhomocysteine nucleosidase
MRLLLVASDSMEFTGILAHSEPTRSEPLPVDWSRTARVGTHEVLLVANGAGPDRAAAAVDAALSRFRPDAAVSTGFCGALAPELAVADVVVATSIAGAGQRYHSLPLTTTTTHYAGVICSIDHVAQTSEEKKRLRNSGAIAVEMEAAGVASKAETNDLPFYCFRAVTDLASEDMANDFNRALRSDGHFDTMLILRGTLRNPLVRLPELFRLRNRCARAASALGEFIADCRF